MNTLTTRKKSAIQLFLKIAPIFIFFLIEMSAYYLDAFKSKNWIYTLPAFGIIIGLHLWACVKYKLISFPKALFYICLAIVCIILAFVFF